MVALYVTVLIVDDPSGGPICYCTDSGCPLVVALFPTVLIVDAPPPQWWPYLLLY